MLGAYGDKGFGVGRGWQGWIFEGKGVESEMDTVMEGGEVEVVGEKVKREGVKARLRLVMRERG